MKHRNPPSRFKNLLRVLVPIAAALLVPFLSTAA